MLWSAGARRAAGVPSRPLSMMLAAAISAGTATMPKVAGTQWFLTDGARSGGFLSAAPATIRGMCGTAPTFPITGLAFGQLQDAYEAAYTDKIADQVYAPNVWDGFHLLAAAMVQQSNKFPSEDVGGEHLRDAITAVSRDGQTFHAGQWRDLISALRANR